MFKVFVFFMALTLMGCGDGEGLTVTGHIEELKSMVSGGLTGSEKELIKKVIQAQFNDREPERINNKGVIKFIEYLESSQQCQSDLGVLFDSLDISSGYVAPFFRNYLRGISRGSKSVAMEGCSSISKGNWKMVIYTELEKKE